MGVEYGAMPEAAHLVESGACLGIHWPYHTFAMGGPAHPASGLHSNVSKQDQIRCVPVFTQGFAQHDGRSPSPPRPQGPESTETLDSVFYDLFDHKKKKVIPFLKYI
jgi:hypothetical protein